MVGETGDVALSVLLMGALLALALLIRMAMERTRVPALVGFLLLGFALRLADHHASFVPPLAVEVIEVLAGIGVVALLFRIGLQSDIRGVLAHLKAAAPIWISNVLATGLPSWAVAQYLLGLRLVESLFVAVALTATSVGVSVGVWDEKRALGTRDGEILLNSAQLDDISGIALMALLFAVAPVLAGAPEAVSLWSTLGRTAFQFAWTFAAFVAACALFALTIERAFTQRLRRLDRSDTTVAVTAIAIMVAAVAEWLGFSLAIGALFAGFVFSRDEPNVIDNHAQRALYDVFVPFFFIAIGFGLDPAVLGAGLGLGLWLVVLAVATKFLSTAVPARFVTDRRGAVLLGLSMIPRAEIAMVVMQRGLAGGLVSQEVYAAMVLVTMATCVGAPLAVNALMTE